MTAGRRTRPWGAWRPIRTACTRCTATCASGARMATPAIPRRRRPIRWCRGSVPPPASIAGATSPTSPGSRARRTATTTCLEPRPSTSGCGRRGAWILRHDSRETQRVAAAEGLTPPAQHPRTHAVFSATPAVAAEHSDSRRSGSRPRESFQGRSPSMVAVVVQLVALSLLSAAQVAVAPPGDTPPAAKAEGQAKPQQSKPATKPAAKPESEPATEPSPQQPPPLILEQAPTGPESTITRVVVFPKHAEVTRTITVDATAGDNTVVFNGLVPVLNPHTLRASVSDGARITGTELRTVYLKESLTAEITRLDKDILALSDDIAAEKRADA